MAMSYKIIYMMSSTGYQFHSASSTNSVYSSFYHFTELLQSTCAITNSSTSRLWLRSLERTDLCVMRMRTHFGGRVFSAAGPQNAGQSPSLLFVLLSQWTHLKPC